MYINRSWCSLFVVVVFLNKINFAYEKFLNVCVSAWQQLTSLPTVNFVFNVLFQLSLFLIIPLVKSMLLLLSLLVFFSPFRFILKLNLSTVPVSHVGTHVVFFNSISSLCTPLCM